MGGKIPASGASCNGPRQPLDAEEVGRELSAQPKATGLPAAEPANPPGLLPRHRPSPRAPLPPDQAAGHLGKGQRILDCSWDSQLLLKATASLNGLTRRPT